LTFAIGRVEAVFKNRNLKKKNYLFAKNMNQMPPETTGLKKINFSPTCFKSIYSKENIYSTFNIYIIRCDTGYLCNCLLKMKQNIFRDWEVSVYEMIKFH